MNKMNRLGIGAAIVMLAGGALACVKAPLTEVLSLQSLLAFEEQREVVFQDCLDRLSERHVAKAVILADLEAGAVSLHEAARQFRDLNCQMSPQTLRLIEKMYVSFPEPERDRRIVIDFLLHYHSGDPERVQRLAERLETELCEALYRERLNPDAEPAHDPLP